MALADLIADVAGLAAFGSATRAARSDIREDLDHIAAGGQVIQVSGYVAGYDVRNANTPRVIVALEIAYHRELSGTTEDAWAHTDSYAIQQAMNDPTVLRALASVHDIVEPGDSALEREGNVVTHRKTWTVSLT